ncbi:P-loop NTPase family protein [Roseimaritima sediminicola]|uniref:hypothetical protein n=1 Tax=Roseimaritima sediminicola TaxID=2662066 RepID=UPI0012984C69|nr:hypothetical protein [Roseimaritima sediminicola]
MSKIDQAFVKAFAKERPQSSPADPEPAVVDWVAMGMSSFWIDPSNNELFRTDNAHPAAAPRPATERRRGQRPGTAPAMPPQQPPVSPTDTTTAPQDEPDTSPPVLRIDAAEPLPAPHLAPASRLDASAFPPITVSHDDFAPAAPAAVAAAPASTAGAPIEQVQEALAEAERAEAERADVERADVERAEVERAEAVEVEETATARPAVEPSAELTIEDIVQPAAEEMLAAAATEPSPVAPQPFEAAWEVDEFEVPAIINQLLTSGGMITGAGVPLAQAARDGMQTVLISSPSRGAGRSTLAVGLALAAATTGIRVALIDGDGENPSLIDALQLELEFGWPEAIRGGVSLAETAVHSIGDGVTLFPIVPAATGLPPQADELHRTVDQLRGHFDLILIDGPCASGSIPGDCFQSAILVRDLRSFDKAAQEASIATLRAAGIAQIGIAENFVD